MINLRQRLPLKLRNRRGAVAVIVAASLFSVSAFGLFVLDTGQIYRQRRHAQTAADAGALAGANEAYRGKWFLVTSSALGGSSTNGYTDGTGNVTVTVHNPPVSGYYIGDARFVEVIVVRRLPTIGLRAFGIDTVGIRARAVAGAGGNSLSCVQTLEPTLRAIWMTSSARIEAPDCSIRINSRSTQALHMEGSSTSIVAGSIGVTGSVAGPGALSPAPTTGIPPAPDPLASLPAPTPIGACNFTNYTLTSGTATISPGVYCGSIMLTNSARVTMNPGVYILCGPANSVTTGLTLQGSSQLNGTGVMIYMTGAGCTSSGAFGPIRIESSAQLNISAPTTGDYAGIAIFQDRSLPIGTGGGGNWPNTNGGYMHTWESNSVSTITGAIYLPTHILRTQSSAVIQGTYTSVIARAIVMESNSRITLNQDFSPLSNVSPIKRLTLVE